MILGIASPSNSVTSAGSSRTIFRFCEIAFNSRSISSTGLGLSFCRVVMTPF